MLDTFVTQTKETIMQANDLGTDRTRSSPTPRTRNAMLAHLDVLVGKWTMQAYFDGEPVAGRVTAEFTWLEGGGFLSQRADVEACDGPLPPGWEASSPFPTWSVAGLDDSKGNFSMLYADGRGVLRVYQMTLRDRMWRIWRDAPGFFQRFTATIAEDGTTITGRWEGSSDGSTWNPDFEVRYTKCGGPSGAAA